MSEQPPPYEAGPAQVQIRVEGTFNPQTGALVHIAIGTQAIAIQAAAARQIALLILTNAAAADGFAQAFDILVPALGPEQAAISLAQHAAAAAQHERARQSGLLLPRKGGN